MSVVILVISGVVAILFFCLAVAPFEALGWYAGWFHGGAARPDPKTIDNINPRPASRAKATPPATPAPAEDAVAHEQAAHYLIYLSGIGAITANSIPEEEKPFIAALEQILPSTKVISDIFPYSVTNLALTGQRITAHIWRAVEKMRLKNPDSALAMLVNGRNLIQMAISADHRYGPIYNLGVARELHEGLVRHGYPMSSGVPVTLVGWSGGAQIALGATWYLPSMIGAPVRVISIGGILSDDKGFEHIEHLWHMWGEKDRWAPLAKILYAGRWRLFSHSEWNRALAAGKITLIPLGPIRHNGRGNYFDNETKLPNGETNMQHLLAVIKQVLIEADLEPAQPAPTESPESPAKKARNSA